MRRVLLIDDHQVVRDGLKSIIREFADNAVFGEAATAPDALRLARDERWDLAVLDISLRDRSGLEVLKELKQLQPNMPVLVLTMHAEEQYARRAYRTGASGYVTKDSPRAELASAIKKVLSGARYISPVLAELLVTDLGRDLDQPSHDLLSDREFEVMRLLGLGKSVSEIAALLSLSDKTVSTYRARVLEKMQFKTNADIVRYAIENRLID
ncbi:MAG: DNA-binding response regulator [Acidobacteria bacterium]|nr:MAG: DNA-binding response regulator [Acidobacteriota bacterium]